MNRESDRNALDKYVTEAKRYPLLSRDEELMLAKRWRDGDDLRAREKLILSNLRFVLKIAHEYTGYGSSLRELVQEGNVGLVIAADRFEPDRGLRFVSYAVWWIRAMILSHVQRSASIVRTGTTRDSRHAFFNLRSTRRRLEAEKQREITPAELARALGMTEQSVLETEQRLVTGDLPLDTGFIEQLRDTSPSPEEGVAEVESARIERKRLHNALKVLDGRERAIIERRILAEEHDSLAAIGGDLSVSRERVRQLERRALRKLKDSLAQAA